MGFNNFPFLPYFEWLEGLVLHLPSSSFQSLYLLEFWPLILGYLSPLHFSLEFDLLPLFISDVSFQLQLSSFVGTSLQLHLLF
jgi:hypothetical protein